MRHPELFVGSSPFSCVARWHRKSNIDVWCDEKTAIKKSPLTRRMGSFGLSEVRMRLYSSLFAVSEVRSLQRAPHKSWDNLRLWLYSWHPLIFTSGRVFSLIQPISPVGYSSKQEKFNRKVHFGNETILLNNLSIQGCLWTIAKGLAGNCFVFV